MDEANNGDKPIIEVDKPAIQTIMQQIWSDNTLLMIVFVALRAKDVDKKQL